MRTGILWFDDSQSSLNVKVQKAVDYYQKKYGQKPTLVLVHPSMFGGGALNGKFSIDGLDIRAYHPVLPGHIWIGVEDQP